MTNPLETAEAAVMALSEAVNQWIDEIEELEAHFILLDDLRRLRDSVRWIEDRVQSHCAGKMEHKMYLGEGLTATKNRTRRDLWDHRKLAFALVDQMCVNQATGEVLVDPDAAVGLLDRLLEVAHVDYWRTGQLASLGIDPDDYRSREWGRWSVRVQRTRSVEEAPPKNDFL